ncbi:MAG TPA: hypothetical protein VFA21_06005 [Pyrinomonadaceae bacterium]|nr:hypothetical protein [Pyrinomonadaceae bacterium]
MTDEKKEKKPLDMTTDEAIDYLFGDEAAQRLREIAKGESPPPDAESNGSNVNGKATQEHDN